MESKTKKILGCSAGAAAVAALVTIASLTSGGNDVQKINGNKAAFTVTAPENVQTDNYEVYSGDGRIAREFINTPFYSTPKMLEDLSALEIRYYKGENFIAKGWYDKGGKLVKVEVLNNAE
jgi:hypothetical protein